MDMHKIHCVDLQIAKKKVYPRNNGTIGIVIYNVARRLSPTAFFSPRFRPFVTIFFNDTICRRRSRLLHKKIARYRYKSPYKIVREKHHHIASNSIDLACWLQISLTVFKDPSRRKILLIRVSFFLFFFFFSTISIISLVLSRTLLFRKFINTVR